MDGYRIKDQRNELKPIIVKIPITQFSILLIKSYKTINENRHFNNLQEVDIMYNTLHKLKASHQLSKKYLTDSFLPFKIFYWLIQKINWSRKIVKNGVSYTILFKNGIGIMNFVSGYETWLNTVVAKILKKEKGAFLDIGANTGQTLLKVVPFFPSNPYIAVEPNGHCVQYLKDLCLVNHFKNVTIFPFAFSNEAGHTELLMRFKDDILATTTPSFRKFTKYSSKEKVSMVIGDEFLNHHQIKNIAVIKIDVEGGEAKVIQGLIETIRKNQPYILCEILPLESKSLEVQNFRQNSAALIIQTMHELQYKIFNIFNGVQILEIDDLSNSLESSNYICLPAHKLDQINDFIVES